MHIELDEEDIQFVKTGTCQVQLNLQHLIIGPYGPGFYLIGNVPFGPFASQAEALQWAKESLSSTWVDMQ